MEFGITRALVFLPLEAGGGRRSSGLQRGLLSRRHVIGEAICGGIFRVVFGEGEGTLSVNLRGLNESTNVMGIFHHR